MQRDVHGDESLGRTEEARGESVSCVCSGSSAAQFATRTQTHLASDAVGTQFSETERRLNPSQHGDDVDVFYTAAAGGGEAGERRERVRRWLDGREYSDERRLSRGLGIVVGPDSLELVQVVGAEHGPVARQVFKVVHDDGNEQVDDLDGDEDRTDLVIYK